MTHKHTAFLVIVATLCSVFPTAALSQGALEKGSAAGAFAAGESFTQDFKLTAYYSPLPNQCCYVKGSLEDDKVLNGQGVHGADGTPVYAGMLAAPGAYPFGTRIALPGLGVLTVHDRGGAIQEQGAVHRLDVWAGHGEEGLARALAFGVQRIRGTVYPPGTPMPAESFDLASLPAPFTELEPFLAPDATLLSLRPQLGDRSFSVQILQRTLARLGYFHEDVTGLFGPATTQSLQRFCEDMACSGDPAVLTEESAALLEAAMQRIDAAPPVPATVGPESSAQDIAAAQRTLRFLDLYRGRTSGKYDETLRHAIIQFQQRWKLVADEHSPGAGRIGPKTRGYLLVEWKRRIVQSQAEQLLVLHRIDRLLAEGPQGIRAFLARGDQGDRVRALQEFLAARGFFDATSVNGVFGPQTEQAVLAYQQQKGIVAGAHEKGAGSVGPMTLTAMRREQRAQLYALVREGGWSAL